MHFGIFLSLSQKVFAEITVRNNLDFGYTAGAVNGADAYEKIAFQQKCYVNFLWLSRFLFLPEHNAMQEEASPGNFLITTDVRLFVGVFMMSNRQTGICQSNASRFPMGIEKPRALYICTSQSAHPTVSEETPLSRRAN